MIYPPVQYHDYLKLDELLNAQNMRSREFGPEAHDEMLFITVHQTYELWFKQILFEVDSVLKIITASKVSETDMGTVVSRLERVTEIQRLLIDQVTVLETMTALDFLDFRDKLFPASGFQSFQFRLLENKMGLTPDARLKYNQAAYSAYLPENQKKALDQVEKEVSLFEGVSKWLERTPFLSMNGFDFWSLYEKAVDEMFASDRQHVELNTILTEDVKQRNLKMIDASKEMFKQLLSENEYKKLQAEGHWRLPHKALKAALLIQLYREEPIFQQPFRLITALLDMDELFTTWRYRHALMAQRMIGTKIGTGGSSGAQYLKDATEKHKVFGDFLKLTTFLIPRSKLPRIPENVREKLGFTY